MGLIYKVKQLCELTYNLKRVKAEMVTVEEGVKGPKAKARKMRELVRKMRDVQEKMGEWELGQLAAAADKEGKKLDKLITLAEAKARVITARAQVVEAKARLRVDDKPKQTAKKSVKKVVSKPKVMPKRTVLTKVKRPRITPKRPQLRR